MMPTGREGLSNILDSVMIFSVKYYRSYKSYKSDKSYKSNKSDLLDVSDVFRMEVRAFFG